MPILLTNSDVRELISPKTAVEVMKETVMRYTKAKIPIIRL